MKYANTKIRILSPAHSEAFQKAVFAEGGKWFFSGKKVGHKDKPYLFVTKYGVLQFSSCKCTFQKAADKEITFDMNTFNFPNDLEDFMVVEHNNGEKGVIVGDRILYGEGFNNLAGVVNVAKLDEGDTWSISKVYEQANHRTELSSLIACHGDLLWERKNTKEIQEKISSIEEKQRQLADELKELQNQL